MSNKKPAKNNPKNDERNIVGSDQVEIQDLEDQVFLIWQNNKGLILGGIGFVFAFFLGFQGLKAYQKSAEAKLLAGYQDAATDAAKKAWAEDEAGHPLSGFAEKELADAAFASGDFATAEAHYHAAAKDSASVVKDAATVGIAVSLLEQGKTADAKSVLETLANNSEAANQAEAQYRLALIAQSEGDTEAARTLIESISDEPQAQFWKARALSLEQELPKSDA